MSLRWSSHPCEHAEVFQRKVFGHLGYDSPTKEALLVLPAILNPFVQDAPTAVMTRIALDWILDGTPLDELFEEVAEDQYTREFTLTHFVQVMLDVACGYRPSPRAHPRHPPRHGPPHAAPSPQRRSVPPEPTFPPDSPLPPSPQVLPAGASAPPPSPRPPFQRRNPPPAP